MEISIKKKNLKWIIIGGGFVIALFFGIGSLIQKSINEKRERQELNEYVEKTIKREYKDLIWEYENYKETLEDYDYSYDFRSRYVSKINKLVGKRVLDDYEMDIDAETDRQIREELHSVAKTKAYKKLLGE